MIQIVGVLLIGITLLLFYGMNSPSLGSIAIRADP